MSKYWSKIEDDFFKIIPLAMLKRLAKYQEPGNYQRTMVIVLTDEIIKSLNAGITADIELHNAPMSYIIFVPEKLIHDYYEKDGKK